jgi:site-specific DNA-cytosine methylase
LRAVDCQAFAGGFTLGVVQAGFKLAAKREMRGGFGLPNCLANRALLGQQWDAQACDPEEWEPRAAELVFSNPPCSAWSTMSPKAFRGVDSPVTSCMWATVEFAARCAPQVVIFESVQPAYSQGRKLMQELHARLEEISGTTWDLHHVLHSAAAVGGTSATRRRYFWVASRVPFGVEPVRPRRVPSVRSAIGDLEDLPATWESQPYRRPAYWWAESRRSPTGVVDGHAWRNTTSFQRTADLLAGAGPWVEGEKLEAVLRRHHQLTGDLPGSWESKKPRLLAKDFWCGVAAPHRWYWDRLAYTITGAGLDTVVHPTRFRGLTHREVARVMGYPDDWKIRPLRDHKGLPATWGKGIHVECGKWIATWARNSVSGTPGELRGERLGEREYLIDVTRDWKDAEVI